MKNLLCLLCAAVLMTQAAVIPVSAEDLVDFGTVEVCDFEDYEAESFKTAGTYLDGRLYIPSLADGDSAEIVDDGGNKVLKLLRKASNATGDESSFNLVLDKAYTGKVTLNFRYKIENNIGAVSPFCSFKADNAADPISRLKGYIKNDTWFTGNGPNNWGSSATIGSAWTPMQITVDMVNGKVDGKTYKKYATDEQKEVVKSWSFNASDMNNLKYFCLADFTGVEADLKKDRSGDGVFYFDDFQLQYSGYQTLEAECSLKGKTVSVDDKLEVKFNQAIALESITKDNFILYEDNLPVEEYTLTPDSENKVIAIVPENGFDYDREYKLTIKKDIVCQDSSIQPMAADEIIVFATESLFGEINIKDGDRFPTEQGVTPSHNARSDVEYSVYLKKDGGEYREYDFSKITDTGRYMLKIEAKRGEKTAIREVEFVVFEHEKPTVSNLSISGTVEVGETVRATYTYSCSEAKEGNSKIQWYVDNELVKTSSPDDLTLFLNTEYAKAMLSYKVLPVSQNDTAGEEVTSAAVKILTKDAQIVKTGTEKLFDFEEYDIGEFTKAGTYLDGKLLIPGMASGDKAEVCEEGGNKFLKITRPLANATATSSKYYYVFDKAITGKFTIEFKYKIENNNGAVSSFCGFLQENGTTPVSGLNSYIIQEYWYTKNRPENWGNTGANGNLSTDWTPMSITVDMINGKYEGITYRKGNAEAKRTWSFDPAAISDIKYFCMAALGGNSGDLVQNRTSDAVYCFDDILVSEYDYPTLTAESAQDGKTLDRNSAVTVDFSVAVAPKSINKSNIKVTEDGAEISDYTFVVSNDSKKVSIVPDTAWAMGKKYTVTVKKDIEPLENKVYPLEKDYTFVFASEGVIEFNNLIDGGRYSYSITPKLNEKQGVVYSARLSKDVGEFEPYTFGTISEIGKYILEVTAQKGNETQVMRVEFAVIGDVAPIAENVRINGKVELNGILEGCYDYFDENGDKEAQSLYRWLVSDKEDGTYTAIADTKTLRVTDAVIDKFIKFEVTPISEKDSDAKAYLSGAVKGLFRPVAKNVVLERKDDVLTVKYDYFDENGDEESGTEFEWYYQTEKTGEYTKIENASANTYTLSQSDADRYISAKVIVQNNAYPNKGVGAFSNAAAGPFLPVASDLKISGTAKVDQTVGADYIYYDENGDEEKASIIKWYVNDDFETEASALALTKKHEGKRIYFTVQPVSVKGEYGAAVKSESVVVGKAGTVKGSSSGGGGSSSGGSIVVPRPDKTPQEPDKEIFADIQSHWAKDAILSLYEKGIVKGVSDNVFDAESYVTRAQIAAMLVRALKLSGADAEFSDVTSDKWYYKDCGALQQAGLIRGADGKFRPDDNITREELCTIISRILKNEREYTLSDLEFDDKGEISAWAVNGVGASFEAGLVNGIGNNIFAPKKLTTRAQAATIIDKLLKSGPVKDAV